MIKSSFGEYRKEMLRIMSQDLLKAVPECLFEYEEDVHFDEELILLQVNKEASEIHIRTWNKWSASRQLNENHVINLEPVFLSFNRNLTKDESNALLKLLEEIDSSNIYKESGIYLDGVVRILRIDHREISWNIKSEFKELNNFIEFLQPITQKFYGQ